MIDTKALKNRILDLAISGKLTEQLLDDGDAEAILSSIERRHTIDLNDKLLDIPDNWTWAILEEVAELYTGNSIPESEKKQKYAGLEEGYDYIGTKDIGFDHVIQYGNGIRIPFNSSFRRAYKGSTLLCIEGGSAGRKIAMLDRDVCFGNKLCMFYSRIIDNEFLYYYLQSPVFLSVFKNNLTGIIGGVSINNLKLTQIPIPPIAEQKRIVSVVEDAFAVIDRIEKAQESYYADQEVLKNKIIDAGIRGKLTEQLPEDGNAEDLYAQIQEEKARLIAEGKIKKEKPLPPIAEDEIPFDIPENWKWVRLSSIFNFIDYRGATPNKIDNGVPFVTAKNVRQGYIDYSIQEYISEEDYNKRQSRGVSHKGDLLFTTEAPMGYAAIADLDKFSAGQRLITLQQLTKQALIENKYYMYVISSAFFQKQLKEKCSGTTVKGIKAERLKMLLVPLLSTGEQNRIVKKIEIVLKCF